MQRHLEESARILELNWDLIDIYQKYRKKNVKVVITSDNMDVFSEQTVPYNKLNNYFDEIYNSSDLGYLKETNDFELYRNLAKTNSLELDEVLIVDDTEKLINNAKDLGFSTYLYNQDTFGNFEKFCEKNTQD